MKTIVIVATLDTKGNEARYLKELIEKKGHNTIIIDAGVLGEPVFKPTITRQEVAKAGGASLQGLISAAHKGAERGSVTEIMIRGVVNIVKKLYSDGKLDGIISIGGGTGTAIGTAAMRALPVGVPKLMVSTLVGFMDTSKFVGTKDIAMMNSVADIVGLNRLTRKILANAAGAIVGMAEMESPPVGARPLIGMVCMGVTTPAVMKAKSLLENQGYETVVFHGSTKPLEELIEEGLIDGVLDLTYTLQIGFYSIEVTGKTIRMDGLKERLKPAYSGGIPQVIAPGGLDMIIFPQPKEEVLKQYPEFVKGRKLHRHGPYATLARTNKTEMIELGSIIAENVNKAAGPVAIVIPLRGFSSVDKEGFNLYDPEADMALIETLKKNIRKDIKVVEVDANINDDEFAERVVSVFIELMNKEKEVKNW